MRTKITLLAVILMTIGFRALAQNSNADNKLKLYGDTRFRVEMDRNSKKSDGSMRADRDRMRIRFRFGFKYTLNDQIEFGGRIRSGNPDNAQSPHVTLGDDFNTMDLNIDKAYIKYQSQGFYLWGGRNSMDLWEPDEMLWDQDVTVGGVGTGYKFKVSDNSKLGFHAGYYTIKNVKDPTDNKQTFNKHNKLLMAQLKYCSKIEDHKLILSAAYLNDLKDAYYNIDYRIFAGYAQFKMNNGLSFNVDYFKNYADLSGKVDPNFEDQKTGWAFSAGYNFTKKFSGKFSYAKIQKYAVIDRYAQDDWVRWGNAVMTRSSNFGGFGLAFKYKITKKFNAQLKFWNVKGLAKATGATALETGTRIRLDFNIKF